MIFIGGISQGQKVIPYGGPAVACMACHGHGRYEIIMVYTYFSFFFIPLFRWSRRYYVRMSCCDALYELSPQVGRAVEKGQQTEIRSEDLTLVRQGNNGEGEPPSSARELKERYGDEFRMRSCSNCGYQFIDQEKEFLYCPRCGAALEEKKEE